MERFIGKTLVFFDSTSLTMIWWDGHEKWHVYYKDGGQARFRSGAAMTITHAIRVAQDWVGKNITVPPLAVAPSTTTFGLPDIQKMN